MISDLDAIDNKENIYSTKHAGDAQPPGSNDIQLPIDQANAINLDNDVEIVDDDEDDEDDDLDDDNNASPDAKSLMPPADQFEELSSKLMKPIADYPVADQAHNVWEITSWSSLPSDKARGPRFRCGNFEWNILLFPRGNGNNSVSIYIEPHPIVENGQEAPDDWYVCAQFAFDFWNPADPVSHLPSSSYHRFTKKDSDWGFSSFVDIKQLSLNPPQNRNFRSPIFQDNKLNVTAFVKVIDDSSTGVLWHNFFDYDSKKNTGYVGLSNQGATCYLNSLLQSYFTTKIFRKLVYQIPTSSSITNKPSKIRKHHNHKGQHQHHHQQTPQAHNSVSLSLQKIFYLLSKSTGAIDTLELTKSFGWDSNDAFTQHDVQELNRILMDKLETSMKNTPIENKLNDIFVGKMKSFIKCINVPYESSRVEDFWDIQMNVKGYSNLSDSFKNYIEIEMLNGENKYQAGDAYGYQDAKKGVVFESFPSVLHLQLKRFEYDFMVDDLVKINDFYEFPDKIDLKPYLDEELPKEVLNQNWNYKLHGVLVHQGSISNGHYYAMIKPTKDDTWLRFDDDKVWKVTHSQVFNENFGAQEISQEQFMQLSRFEQNENIIRRSTSAYMLVYYRESELDNILLDDEVVDESIPSFIPIEIKNQLSHTKMLEDMKIKKFYNLNIKFITLSQFQHYDEFDLFFDPKNTKFFNRDKLLQNKALRPLLMSIKKTESFLEVYNKLNNHLNIPEITNVSEITSLPYRLLIVSHRNNQTNRIDTELQLDENQSVASVYTKHFNKKYDEMVFFIYEVGKDLNEIKDIDYEKTRPQDFRFDKVFSKFHLATTSKEKKSTLASSEVMVFLKYYDHTSNELRGLTHLSVSRDQTVESIIPSINKLLNFDVETPLEIYEELTPYKLEAVDLSNTFEKNELSTGDILCVQVKDAEVVRDNTKFTNPKEYFKFLVTRVHIKVSSKSQPLEDEEEEEANAEDLVIDLDKPQDTEMELPSETDLEAETETETESEITDDVTFDMWISTLYGYDQLAEEISSRINQHSKHNVDADRLRLFVVNQQGIRFPLNTNSNLSQFFPKTLPLSTIVRFEYEVLDISLREYENMKLIKIYWLNKILHYQYFELLVPLEGTVRDLIVKITEKINYQDRLNDLLIWSGNNNKYVDLLKYDTPIESLNDSFDYYIGKFPIELNPLINYDLMKRFNDEPLTSEFETEEEQYEYDLSVKYSKNLNLIQVFHFYKSSNYHHSVPFLFLIFPNETFADLKKRLKFKLGVNDLNFNKIKFALADSNDKGKYLDEANLDDLVLYDEIGKSNVSLSLALDHPDRSPKRNPFDRGIQIK